MAVDAETKQVLRRYAARYEEPGFIEGDPSWFMYQVAGDANREATAFVASCLSFGSRKQFMPKIQAIVDCAGGNVDLWIREGRFARTFPKSCGKCFYRFFTEGDMRGFLDEYRRLLAERGTLGDYVRGESGGDGYEAVKAICRRFLREFEGPVLVSAAVLTTGSSSFSSVSIHWPTPSLRSSSEGPYFR